MRNYQNQPAVLLYILFLFALGACNTSPRNIPFPQQESEFAKPAIEKLTFGEQQKLDLFLQTYAVEKTRLEARRKGHILTEQQLSDGSIKLTIHVGA